MGGAPSGEAPADPLPEGGGTNGGGVKEGIWRGAGAEVGGWMCGLV
jgi:hypothetical protein